MAWRDLLGAFWQRRPHRLLPGLFVSLTLMGCAQVAVQKVESLPTPPKTSKIVLMTPHVELYEMTFAGLLEPKAEWTEKAISYIKAALTDELQSRKAPVLTYQTPADPDKQHAHVQFLKLHEAVGRAILMHQYKDRFRLPNKGGRFDWELGPSVSAISADHDNADHALFVSFVDAYQSAGRLVATAIFGGARPQQVGVASLVDLRSGQIVWFGRLIDPVGDLREADGARRAVKNLLMDLPL